MKKKLYKAFESATPNVLDQVLQACPVPEKESAEKGIIHRADRQWYKSALSTAAAVALLISVCGVAVWMFSRGQLGITDPTEPSTEATLSTDPTQTDTLPPPTTEPIQTETTEPTEPSGPAIWGFASLNHNDEIPTNPEGIPVIAYGYHNHYSNGFILDSTGEAFLSLHGGKLTWVDANACMTQINHNGKDYRVEFVWCSYAGEVGLISSRPNVAPIIGSDRYVSLRIEKYPYLLDLQTMEAFDPFEKCDIDPLAVTIKGYAPDGKTCLVTFDDVHYLIELATGQMLPVTELTGLENVSYVYYVNQENLAVVDVFEDEYPQEYRANGYLYNIQNGTRKDLYEDAEFGWLSDSGGVEHYGSMYLSYNYEHQVLQVTNCMTGQKALTDIAYIPSTDICGIDQVLVVAKAGYKEHDSAHCLINSNGDVTPMFVTEADTLVESVLGKDALPSHPPFEELLTFLYEGKNPFYWVTPDVSGCDSEHLYYYHEKSGKVAPICDEPVLCYNYDNSALYFVKAAEPNKLYRAPLTNLKDQRVIYESDFGAINDIYAEKIGAYINTLMLTEGNKRGVLLDLVTGESEIFIEQYYFELATIEDMQMVDGKRTYNRIWFRGKLNEEDTLKDYLYYIDTGKVIESYYL